MRWSWSSLTLLGLLLVARPARADDSREKAIAHYRQGNSHYQLSEYREALVEFKAAFRERSDPAFLYNIAQCHRMLAEYGDALLFFKRYLRLAPQAPNRAEVEKKIRDIEVIPEAQRQPSVAGEARVGEAGPAGAPGAPPAGRLPTPAAASTPSPLSSPPTAPQVGVSSSPVPVSAPVAASAAAPAVPPVAPITPLQQAPVPTAAAAQLSASPPPLAPEPAPLYQRWWFWAGLGAVAVGVGAALLVTRPSGAGPGCAGVLPCEKI